MAFRIDIRSISVQLLVLVLIVAIVPIVALTYMNYSSLTASKNAQFDDKIGDVSIIASDGYQALMDRDNSVAVELSNDHRIVAAMKKGDGAAIKAVVDEYDRDNSYLDIIAVTKSDGIVLARSGSDKAGDVETGSYVAKALRGMKISSNEIISADKIKTYNLEGRVKDSGVTEGLAIVSAMPVKDENGAVIGALYVAELQNGNNDMVDSIQEKSNTLASIFQGDIRIATTVKDASGNRALGSKALSYMSEKVLAGGIYQGIYEIGGSPYYGNYEPMKNSEGEVVGMLAVGYDMAPGMAELNNMVMLSIMIGVVLALLSVGAGYVIVSRITRPINRLVTVSDSIAAGNLDTPVDTGPAGSEIRALTGSIRTMVSNIKERIAYNESVLKGIRTPMFVTDTDRKITYFNRAASEMTGVRAEDAIGRHCKDIFNTPICGTEECILKCAWREGGQKSAEIDATLKGRNATFSVDASSVLDQHGKVTGGLELLRDISQSRLDKIAIEKAEKDAREKALFSGSILKSITDAHIVTDVNGKITYINEFALKLIGVKESEALGRTLEDLIGIDRSIIRKALAGSENICNKETRICSRGGVNTPLLASVTMLKDISGNVTGANAMFRDITREKAAKQQLQEITKSAAAISQKVASTSASLSSASQQTMASSRQISEGIQQIASGSQTQAQRVEEISKLMHDMNSSIGHVTEGARETSKVAVDANTIAKQGSDNAKIAIVKMDELHQAVNDSAKIVRDLGQKSQQIVQIVDMITAISGQTNLLALNAAIEAARAGEAGRGFAVVAEEVRKLAEEAAKAAEEINVLIGEVKVQTDKAVESMDKGTYRVDESNKVVAEALKSLEDIGRMINITAGRAKEIASMTEIQAQDTVKVVKSVEEIAAIIEESASGSEEVSASAEESTATIEQVAGMAADLTKIAEELNQEVKKLNVE